MKKIISTDFAPAAIGPYSQAVLVQDTLYVSGQIAIIPENGELSLTNIDVETHQIMKNLQSILKAANMRFSDVVKCTIFLKSMSFYSDVNKVYSEYFPDDPPAREAVEVSSLPKNVNVEISVIAVFNE